MDASSQETFGWSAPIPERRRRGATPELTVGRSSYSHVVGFDDGSFDKYSQRYVPVVGAVFSGLRLEGVLTGRVTADGANATRVLIEMVAGSKFAAQLQLVLLQGIALGGFNVVDLHRLHEALGLPVIVVARRRPRLEKIREALLTRVPGGARKWALIERLGPMERLAGVYVQRLGLSRDEAERVIRQLSVNANIPEPLRTAHLIAGGIATGQSRGRP
ncbi:MAG: DUF99 family protein [Gemmatimonadetes bacterium]|uniref:DUF99 family protein n=1 Tax=Candidatus Kutchimonas denitrificans TaxID=3056748 RepID=A0AAE4Z7Q6_9BACT|nr:DUF99 family protein [Gemmatimonadota bacterium]NIR75339.1 DUF99 family protein [Candidatus Kutchimonas denitrificans]NIS00971.1 DUF99 family protein [Gemmatimonadota bacterium]NIT66598.1 DUF99 family protein [Gemmatimonadota bacterium]NIU53168.1 DUF99 family protein [Gemmatimonadota bacterium]